MDAIETLILTGARVNLQARNDVRTFGTSALHVACRAAAVSNVQVLLLHAAKIEAEDGSGLRALHLAAAHDMSGV